MLRDPLTPGEADVPGSCCTVFAGRLSMSICAKLFALFSCDASLKVSQYSPFIISGSACLNVLVRKANLGEEFAHLHNQSQSTSHVWQPVCHSCRR